MNNLKLVQKSFPFGSTSLSVSDDRELTVVFKSLSNTNTFTIPIDQLLARPSEHRRINYVVLVLFSMSATISALSAYVLATTADYEGVGNKALISLLIAGVICLLTSAKLKDVYSNLLIYRDARTRDVLFAIKPKSPSQEIVDDFVDSLERRIKSISYGGNLTKNEKYQIYIKHLEFLLEQKVITDEEFKIISQRIGGSSDNNIVSLVRS